MTLGKDVCIRVSIMEPKEIDLGDKAKGRKRRRMVDEYDYNDPFIEPFEGETQAVRIECSLEDFFVYQGELPYSAKKVLSVHKARRAKEETKIVEDAKADAHMEKEDGRSREVKEKPSSMLKTPTVKRHGKIPKSDLKGCEYLASLVKFELDRLRMSVPAKDDGVECYAYRLILEAFHGERKIKPDPDLRSVSKPVDEETNRYIGEGEDRMNRIFDEIAGDVHGHHLYSDGLTLFRGFQKESFLFNLCEYFLLFMKISFLRTSASSFNGTRREAYGNVLGLFSTTCRNSSQTQHYLIKHMSQTCGIKNIFGDGDEKAERSDIACSVSSNNEVPAKRSSPLDDTLASRISEE